MLSFNWVAAVRRADGSPAVLKLGVPSSEHLAEEAAALTSFAGAGAVRLLDRDAGRGALLLERAHPGTMLRDLVPARDEEATAVAVGILRRLHVEPAAGGPLPDLVRYGGAFRRLPREHPLLPRRLVDRAARLFDELCATAPARVVLHGDLHHGNILRADREPWLAIDPHGVIGDPGYEIARCCTTRTPATATTACSHSSPRGSSNWPTAWASHSTARWRGASSARCCPRCGPRKAAAPPAAGPWTWRGSWSLACRDDDAGEPVVGDPGGGGAFAGQDPSPPPGRGPGRIAGHYSRA